MMVRVNGFGVTGTHALVTHARAAARRRENFIMERIDSESNINFAAEREARIVGRSKASDFGCRPDLYKSY